VFHALLLPGVFALLSVVGCGGDNLKLVPVKGKVTLDGSPVPGGSVTFVVQQLPKGQKSPGPSTGQIDPSGNFELFTNGQPGAPEGKYKAFLSPNMVPDPNLKGKAPKMIPDKYRKVDDNPLPMYEVKEGAAPGAYDIKLTTK
jgi:hypothetical protein